MLIDGDIVDEHCSVFIELSVHGAASTSASTEKIYDWLLMETVLMRIILFFHGAVGVWNCVNKKSVRTCNWSLMETLLMSIILFFHRAV